MLTLNEEKKKLEAQLAGVAQTEERLREVCQLLGEDIKDEDIGSEDSSFESSQ